MLARESVGLRLYLRLYPALRIIDSEEISKKLFNKEEVVCLEAELDGGRRGYLDGNVVESMSLKGYFSLGVSRYS